MATKNQFQLQTFVDNVGQLRIGETFHYPANGYFTMLRVRGWLREFEGKYYKDSAINKTYRSIERVKPYQVRKKTKHKVLLF